MNAPTKLRAPAPAPTARPNVIVGMWHFRINDIVGAIAMALDTGLIVLWNNHTLGGLNDEGLRRVLGEDADPAAQAGRVIEFANERLAQRLPHSEIARMSWEIEQWLRTRKANPSARLAMC